MENEIKTHHEHLTVVVLLAIMAVATLVMGGINTSKDIDQISKFENYNLVGHQGRVAGVAVEQVEIKVDLSDHTVLTMDVEVNDGDTVMEALREMVNFSGLMLKTTKYDFGELVDQIGDLQGGQDNKYWIFYVNGESALMSADTMEVAPGDVVEFHFEESIF